MSFGAMKMMNDKEFRQKCREFSYQQMKDYFKDYQERDAFKSKEGIATALLYIAANMPNLNDEKKKQEMENNKSSIDVGDIVRADDTLYLLIEAPDDYELVDLDLDSVELGNYETPMEAQADLDRIYGVNNYRIIKKNDFMRILNEIED